MSPGWLGIGCHQVNGSASQDDPNNHNGNPHNHRRSIPITAGCIVQWYTNATLIPGEPSLPDEEWAKSPMRTFFQTRQPSCFGEPGCTWEKTKAYRPMGAESIAHDMGDIKSLRKHPWRAPGTAPLYSPCGHSGGNPLGCPPGHPGIGNCDAGGYGHGQDARTRTMMMLSRFVALSVLLTLYH